MAEMSRNIKIKLLFGLEGPGVDEAVKSVQKLSKSVSGLTGTALKATAAFVAFKGLKAAFEFGRESIDQANLLQRGLAGMSSVFGSLTPQMMEFVKNSTDLGMSMSESSKAVTFIGSVLKQSGFAMDEVAGLTKQLITLGADLAYTYGYDVQEALLAMTALFRGEYDPIEKFGVAMKQNEIESIKAERGLKQLTGAAEIFADQQIRIELLLQRSSDAQGAYARNSQSLFVQQQALAATFQNVQAVVGLQLTPALSNLTLNVIPLVETLTPLLISLFETLIPVVQNLVENKQQLLNVVATLLSTFGFFVEVLANIAIIVTDHITLFRNLAVGLITLGTLTKTFLLLRDFALIAAQAIRFVGGSVDLVNKRLKVLKYTIATTGIGLLVTILGTVGAAALMASEDIKTLEAEADAYASMDYDELIAGTQAATQANLDLAASGEEVAGAAGKVKNAVGDFYSNLQNEIAKQQAKLTLQNLGASEGLINLVLGSGEDWYQVFQEVTRRGMDSVREVQALFRQTAAGFDEAMQEWQEKYDAFLQFKQQAEDARDAFIDFVKEFDVLPSIERQLGRFEQAAATQLENIKDKLDDAFDNKYLLKRAYDQLNAYAEQEFAVLQQIQRQRDDIMARRDAAEALIKQVNDNILSSGRLVNALQDVQNETEKLDIASVVKRTVQEARTLREFEVIVTSAVIQPIDEVVSKSEKLVQGYRGIVERTRAFVTDMKALRALGLDPKLFNDLVEAGVDAGGATAQALVEGGSETVNEVNALFSELNALGAELGEQTAQVMYGQGEMFVDGIVKGLEAQAAQLEEQARELAEAFTDTFENMLVEGIRRAIEAARRELGNMPTFDGGGGGGGGGGGDGGGGGGGGGTRPTVTIPHLPGYRPSLGEFQANNPPPPRPIVSNPNMPSIGGGAPVRPPVYISGTPVRPGNTTYNVYNTRIDQRSLNTTLNKIQTNNSPTSSRSNSNLRVR